MGDLVEFLRHKLIGEVAGLVDTLIEAKTTTCALEGYRLLVVNNILSIPLFDDEKKNYISFLDIMDVLFYLTDENSHQSLEEKLQNKTCGELANFSKLDPFLRITDTTNLIKVLQVSSQDYRSLHRFPVVDSAGKLRGIVSQSLLVRFLEPHTKRFDFGTLSVGVLGLGLDKKVVTVSDEDTVLTAVQKLKEHKISGIGIINKDGKLIGNFDATSIKYIGFGHNGLQDIVKLTMSNFLEQTEKKQDEHTAEYPVKVTRQAISHQVIVKFKEHGVHRVFVVDDNGRPIGIISLFDVLELFFRHILIE